MTSVPDAPGADGVYLFREEIGDDKNNFHSTYVRLKILNEEGKQKYADVEMPTFQKGHFRIADVQGRTIHSDGTIVPYTGKPIDKLVVKSKEYQYHTTVFTMPDVQVGSILEYRYDLRYDDNFAVSPTWVIQQEIPVRSAHYRFVPTQHDLTDSNGAGANSLLYTRQLPAGVDVQYLPSSNTYELRVSNIPAFPKEDYMPPIQSLGEQVIFYYSPFRSQDQFWKEEGKYWSKAADKFANPSSKIQQAVQETVAPGDSQVQKLQKIYDAMMKIENTSFTRRHSAEENKSEGIKIKTAEDIWAHKMGSDDEITLLFIAMARAAGFKAYAMEVTNRDTGVFRPSYLSLSQLDDDVAIVVVDGKEQYFDPGQRYCAFGQMHWKHSMAEGIRQTDNGVVVAETPVIGYKDSGELRTADLTMTPDGQLSGSVRVLMTGNEALKWRQAALTTDEEEVKKNFEEELQQTLPPGAQVKTNHFIGLTDWKTGLMATLDVSGNMGTATSKRIFLPSSFFEGKRKSLFSSEKRELPIDLQYPSQVSDKVTLKLPQEFVAESVPKGAQLSLSKRAAYGTQYKADGSVFTQTRMLVLATSFFDAKEYGELRDFYQKINAQDQEQLVLKAAAAGAAPGAAQ